MEVLFNATSYINDEDGDLEAKIEAEYMSHTATFDAYEVVSRNIHNKDDVEWSQYPCISAFIKWDGCSTVIFKDPEDGELGNMHFCGSSKWRLHNVLMSEMWKMARKTPAFDEGIAED